MVFADDISHFGHVQRVDEKVWLSRTIKLCEEGKLKVIRAGVRVVVKLQIKARNIYPLLTVGFRVEITEE